MADTREGIEQQVENIILASFAHQQGDSEETTAQDEAGEKRVIDVDLYHLEGGAVLLVPKDGTNPLDTNAIESQPPTPQEQETPITESPLIPLLDDEQQEEGETPQDTQPEPAGTGTKRRVKRSVLLVPLVLLCMLAAGTASSLYLLPLTASATITITPKARSLHSDATFTIAASPKAGQVQGRPLVASSFSNSKSVPATGHAHDDATSAAGILTFYNADSQSYTIPVGTSFMVQGVTVVTDTTVTVQAAVPPSFGTGITQAHVIQVGTVGNIAAHAINTRCCGSQFVTATNTSAFSGGQDARSYSFIQTGDIHNAATDLLASLTPKTTVALQKQVHAGEQLVTPLCSPRTQGSAEPGAEGVNVTVSVTQTCSSVAYQTSSLNLVATSTLAHSLNLANYEQVGTVQVTVNGSTYQNHTATLKGSVSGVWVYRFTKQELTRLTHHIAGESTQKARETIERVNGVAQVSIHLQRLDFNDLLPTDPQHIAIQFFYIVS
jgi:hypothetical protein